MPPEVTETTETAAAPDDFATFQEAIKQNSTQAEQPAAEAKAEETGKTGDTEASATPDTTPETTEEAADQGEETAEEELLTEEQKKAIGNDPAKLEKELKRAFTQKTQALAEIKKQVEPWSQIIDLYNQDPIATITAIAEKHGLKLVAPDAGGNGNGDQPANQTSEVTAEVESILGEDLAFLAPALTKAVERLAQKYTQNVVDSEIKPLKVAEQERLVKQAEADTDKVLAAMTDKHKDWKQYEKQMVVLGKKFQPGPDLEPLEYLETLYDLATKGKAAAKATKSAIERINSSVKNAEPPPAGVNTERVTKTLPKGDFSTRMDAAWEAAKRGEVLLEE